MIFWGAQSNKRKPHYAELIVKLTKNCFISGFKCTQLYRQAKSICSHFWFLLVPGKPKLEEWGGKESRNRQIGIQSSIFHMYTTRLPSCIWYKKTTRGAPKVIILILLFTIKYKKGGGKGERGVLCLWGTVLGSPNLA